MAWTITKEGDHILKLDSGVSYPFYINFRDVTLSISGDVIKFTQKNVTHSGVEVIKFLYTEVTTPTSTSAEDLADKVAALFVSSGSGGGGDATEAKQDDTIGAINTTSASELVVLNDNKDNTFRTEIALNRVIELLEENNKYLRKIYNPE